MFTDLCHVLPGVGAQVSKLLAKCGLRTIQDVLLHLPHRYQDRTRVTPIRDLRLNDWAVVVGRLIHVSIQKGRRPQLECVLADQTGQMKVRFFHFYAAQLEQLQVGTLLRIFGETRRLIPVPEMIHPEYHLPLDSGQIEVEEKLTPIYSLTQGLSQTRMRTIVKQAIEYAQPNLSSFEWMEPEALQNMGMYSFERAIDCLHYPPPDLAISTIEVGTHPALKRLIVEELLADKISMMVARQTHQGSEAPPCFVNEEMQQIFLNQLRFELTQAQKRVAQEIAADLSQTKPMLRLVQGDVGSGKTVVAGLAALQVIQQGHQVALMAPTELLSEQHANNLRCWFEPMGFKVLHLHGKLPAKQKKEILAAIQSESGQLIVGTHAIFQEKVKFCQLGLVIIDEQHRFGVAQRLALVQKSEGAHQLLMTATPIPRTLKMAQWSFLDISLIDELPPTRTPVVTAVMSQHKRADMLHRLQEVIAQGRQAYWVCPLIETSEKLQCQAAVETSQQLQQELPKLRIGLIHGRLKNIEKEAIMQAFKSGEIDLLVATTVIEVGVDVPNASLMIIENAERMGLAQLHQLRGRVGRGTVASYCILLYQPPLSVEGLNRLTLLRDSTDGFAIAEYDLLQRGGGEILGTRQTGYRLYKIADLARDHVLLPEITKLAKALLTHSPDKARWIAERWKGTCQHFLNG